MGCNHLDCCTECYNKIRQVEQENDHLYAEVARWSEMIKKLNEEAAHNRRMLTKMRDCES